MQNIIELDNIGNVHVHVPSVFILMLEFFFQHNKLVNSEERKNTLEVDNSEWFLLPEVWLQALKKALASEGIGDMGDPTFEKLFEQNERFFTISKDPREIIKKTWFPRR
ncbi:hypothetical protein GIB67_006831 [Kingdonia uniflora]|uniref:Uncharacterized protein n=1 Tax=Kingdonia uniflora TaxID=39325 RepID=A0A7J7L011_9MAGN|nr:hypothetical protein GIB67_006831 [Kingdonia uniflora]